MGSTPPHPTLAAPGPLPDRMFAKRVRRCRPGDAGPSAALPAHRAALPARSAAAGSDVREFKIGR
jgi:hypothetical protein